MNIMRQKRVQCTFKYLCISILARPTVDIFNFGTYLHTALYVVQHCTLTYVRCFVQYRL